ncbi:hypothetical protein Daus18300_010400 [Diaporthe australafricana]|uniref:Uncharacterized protein n=1 Tax=Diaporthe australafricana TaxID=127596 RepID=A0ABR3WAR5_9PEZI
MVTFTKPSGSAADDRSSSQAANALRPLRPSEPPGTVVAAQNEAAATAAKEDPPIPAHLQSTVDEYKRLLAANGNAYGGHITTESQYRKYLAAQKLVTTHGGKGGDLSLDFPADERSQQEIAKRIHEAIVNTGEPQDGVTETGDYAKSLAVTTVCKQSAIQVEILAVKFREQILKCQRGERVVLLNIPVKQEASYMAKLDKVVEALSANKLLCRSAISGGDWIARIVADPDYQRSGKIVNLGTNATKKGLLKEAKDARAAALVKGGADSPQKSDEGQSQGTNAPSLS